MKKVLLAICLFFVFTANAFADLKQEYTEKIISGEIDPTEISFEQYKGMNKSSGVDLKQEYTEKIVSGEIDPTEISFEQYKAGLGGVQTNRSSNNETNSSVVTQNDVTDHNDTVTSSPQESKDVEESIEKYLKAKGLKTGLNNKGKHKGTGKYIVYKIMPVSKDINDKRFRDSVGLAYEKAYFEAQKKLAMEIYGKTLTDKAMSIFENNSDNVDQQFKEKLEAAKDATAKMDTIFGKIKKLADAKLDKALVQEGVSLEQLKTLSVKMKQELYREEFMKNVSQSFSAKELLGSAPIQTFLGMWNKAPAVGVVMMKSDKTAMVATDISKKRKPRVTKAKGKDPMSLLPKDEKGFLKEYGVRLFFDENGFPAIISYAQKGVVSRSDNASRIAKAIASATSQAGMNADSQISEFLSVVMSAEDKKTTGEKEQTVLKNRLNKVSGEEELVEETTSAIIEIMQETAKASSKMDNAGISEIYKWNTEDDLGNKVVGVVNLWSYDQLAAAQRIQSGEDVDYGSSEKEKEAMKKVFIETQGGKDVVDVDDF